VVGVDDVDPLGEAAVVNREEVSSREGEELRYAGGAQLARQDTAAVELVGYVAACLLDEGLGVRGARVRAIAEQGRRDYPTAWTARAGWADRSG
jgi:hypothetical protein